MDQKSKSPLFPGPGGGVITNDYCITMNRKQQIHSPDIIPEKQHSEIENNTNMSTPENFNILML